MTVRRSNFAAPVLAAVMLSAAASLSGCAGALDGNSGHSRMGDSISPAIGGLPVDAPERPVSPGVYPAVHDMPPPRNDTVLDESQQAKLESDLAALRTRQAKETGADKPAASTNKKPAATPSASQAQ